VQTNWFSNRKSTTAWDDANFREGGSDNQIARQIAQKSSDDRGTGWRIGESVSHARFGEGVIVNIEGGAGSARAQINFGAAGMKVLDLSVAKLERVGR
jgi:DNA helicase II / ATP-dependent DNA helicase PcrA